MTSRTTPRFRKAFKQLPAYVQKQARQAYKTFQHDPYHPSLHFKRVHPSKPIFSVRISLDYRAVAVEEGNQLLWFGVGGHAEHDTLIAHL